MKFTVQQFYEMSDDEFRDIYENQEFKNTLDFLETRIRLEILTIIRRFQLKGEVSFEVRQKSTTSAYSKLQSELVERQAEFGNRPVELFEVLRDLIGVRLICVHEEVQKRVFEYMLQVESIVIQSEDQTASKEFKVLGPVEMKLRKNLNHQTTNRYISMSCSLLRLIFIYCAD